MWNVNRTYNTNPFLSPDGECFLFGSIFELQIIFNENITSSNHVFFSFLFVALLSRIDWREQATSGNICSKFPPFSDRSDPHLVSLFLRRQLFSITAMAKNEKRIYLKNMRNNKFCLKENLRSKNALDVLTEGLDKLYFT